MIKGESNEGRSGSHRHRGKGPRRRARLLPRRARPRDRGAEEVASQRVRAHFVPVGESTLELLEATSPDSPIAKYVEKRGPGLHHITLRVEDIDAAVAQLKARGARLIDEQPRPGAEGALIAFVHPSAAHGVLVELKQSPSAHERSRRPSLSGRGRVAQSALHAWRHRAHLGVRRLHRPRRRLDVRHHAEAAVGEESAARRPQSHRHGDASAASSAARGR